MQALGLFQQSVQQDQSLSDFHNAFDEYCNLNLHQPVEIFGSTNSEDNDAYTRMIDFMVVSNSEFLVVIPNARHLGPNIETVARTLVELENLGAKVVCDNEHFPDPVQNAFQTLGVKGTSQTRSKRILESMRRRAARGQTLGKPPYGYSIGPDGRLIIVNDEATVVELIFRLYTKSKIGMRLIAQHLNEHAISTRRGGNWNVTSVREILKNHTYIGTATRLGMQLPQAHKAIIPAEIFRAGQETTRARRPLGRINKAKPFLLSGLVYCSYCGNKMMGVTRRQSWKRKDNRRSSGVYRYYQCQSRNNQSVCKYHTWRTILLEKLVLARLEQTVRSDQDNISETRSLRSNRAIQRKEARFQNAERRFNQAFRRAARGSTSIQSLQHYLDELDTARRVLGENTGVDDIAAMLKQWSSLDIDTLRTFLTANLDRIVVSDDSVEIIV